MFSTKPLEPTMTANRTPLVMFAAFLAASAAILAIAAMPLLNVAAQVVV